MESIRRVVESTLVPHTAFNRAAERLKQGLAYSLNSPEPICLAIVGESRTGKSRVLEEVALDMPNSRTPDGVVVPILRIRVPSSPTVKGLAELMLKALGDPKWESGTQNNKTARLQTQMKKAKTLMLMLDEFQHFFDKGKRKIFHDAADWLKILVDETRVTLVVTGLESCLPVLLRNEKLSGRFLAPVFMRRFNWLDDDDRMEFTGILGAFNDSMAEHFDLPLLQDKEMAYRCWCATGGLIGYLSKFLRQVVWNACDGGRRVITLEELQAAHVEAIWATQGSTLVDSPFDRSFAVGATQESIARALSLGTHSDQDDEPPRRRRPAGRKSGGTLAQNLVGG